MATPQPKPQEQPMCQMVFVAWGRDFLLRRHAAFVPRWPPRVGWCRVVSQSGLPASQYEKRALQTGRIAPVLRGSSVRGGRKKVPGRYQKTHWQCRTYGSKSTDSNLNLRRR